MPLVNDRAKRRYQGELFSKYDMQTSNIIHFFIQPSFLLQEEETIKILSETSNGSSTLGEVPKEEDANLDFPLNKPVQPQENNGTANAVKTPVISPKNSGIFLYVDIHGHASKRGIFM